jgi:general secretion pathway protein K
MRRLSEREKKAGGYTQEHGAALVTALLAISLLTIVVVEFAYSSQVDYHLAHNALKALQASCLARSGVNVAILVLKKDAESSGIDSLGESWAHPLPPLPAGQGTVVVSVSDEQGKLNLNTLRNSSGTINDSWREVAGRVFTLRGLDPQLLDPLLDWLDSDDFPEPRGAESAHYLGLTPPDTPRNGPFLTLGELGRVEGFTPVVRARISEVITVLPSNNTSINVNTAPVEILSALFPELDLRTLDQFRVSRAKTPVRGVNDVRDRLGLDPRTAADTLRLVTMRSEFFAISAVATVEPINQMLSVVVQRRAATVTPIFWRPTTPLGTRG